MNSKLENQPNVGKSPNDPSSPTGGPKPPESKPDAEPPVRCSAWLGDESHNINEENQSKETGNESLPTHIGLDSTRESSETGAATPIDHMVLLKQNLKVELNRRMEDVKKTEKQAKSAANTNNRGGLLDQWYRLQYSLRSFVGSWVAWDDSKRDWYRARPKSPNDPSSPTPAQAGEALSQGAEKGVRCSAWLGDEIHKEIVKQSRHGGILHRSNQSKSSLNG